MENTNEMECSSCGAYGKANFTSNDFGELVCNLCGTQNFIYNANETQDIDDAIGSSGITMSGGKAVTRKKYKKRPRKAVEESTEPVQIKLEDCLQACQMMLISMCEDAIQNCHIPKEIKSVVKKIWFLFLKQYSIHGKRPLLSCFLETNPFKSQRDACTAEASNIWDLSIPRTQQTTRPPIKEMLNFDNFRCSHLIAMLYIGCRMISLGIQPSDIQRWIKDNRIRVFGFAHRFPEALRTRIQPVARFFYYEVHHLPKVASIGSNAAYLEYHLKLKLPVINFYQIGYNLMLTFKLPRVVYAKYLQLLGLLDPAIGPLGDKHRDDLCPVDLVCYFMLAIMLSPNWHQWIYRLNTHDDFIPWNEDDLKIMPRKHLLNYINFVDQMCRSFPNFHLKQRKSTPVEFHHHMEDLKKLLEQEGTDDEILGKYLGNDILSFYPQYVNTTPSEYSENESNESRYFFPFYFHFEKDNWCHGPVKQLIFLMGEYLDVSEEWLYRQLCKWSTFIQTYINKTI